jgi:hypothetical protein
MKTLASQIQLTRGKPPSNGPIPPRRTPSYRRPTHPRGQPPFYVTPRGETPFASHTLVINLALARGKIVFVGNPSQSWGVSLGKIGSYSYLYQ